MKKILIFLFVFLLGVVFGFGTAVFYFEKIRDVLLAPIALKIGDVLDEDCFVLKSGKAWCGKILAEENGQMLVTVPNGSINLRPNEIERIDKNYYTRYLKEAW